MQALQVSLYAKAFLFFASSFPAMRSIISKNGCCCASAPLDTASS